jgi:signal transduction histidine kinase
VRSVIVHSVLTSHAKKGYYSRKMSLALYLRALEYLVFTACVLFAVKLVTTLLDYRLHRDPGVKDYLGLTASSLTYSFGFWLTFQHQGIPYSFYIEHLTWLAAVAMVIFYFRAVARFLGDQSRFVVWNVRTLQLMFGVMFCATLIMPVTGHSFLFQPVPFPTRNTLWHAVGGDLSTPSPLMAVFGLLSILLSVSGSLHFARVLLRNHRQERLLLLGILLALVSTTNDVLASFGLLNTISLIFLSKGFEIIRIGRHYRLKAEAKVRALEGELSDASKQALTSFITRELFHDINNLLTVMLLNTEELLQIAPELQVAQNIEKTALRIRRTSQNYVRLFTESQSESKLPLDVSEIIARAIELTQPRLRQFGVSLQLSPSQGELRILGNAAQVELILANLIDNAANSTRSQAEGRIWVEARRGQGSVVILIRDNGGPCDALTRLRALRVAHQLVKANLGQLTCDTVEDGACFEVSLPLA